MKKTSGTRILSFLLTLVMAFGLVAVTPLTASAVVEYATPATQEELDNVALWFTGNNGAGGATAYAKIVNGAVYVWGRNADNALGITSFVNTEGETVAVSNGTVVPVPTKIPESYFNNEKVVRVRISFNTGVAVTEQNNIFVWGVRSPSYYVASGGATPQQIDTSALNGHSIVKMSFGCTNLYVQDDAGDWYTAGGGSATGVNLMLGETAEKGVLTKVPVGFYALVGASNGSEIAGIYNSWDQTCYVVMKNGKLFGFGVDSTTTYHTLGVGTGQIYKTAALELTNYTGTYQATDSDGNTTTLTLTSNLNGLHIIDMVTEDQGRLLVDSNGDVWGWGSNSAKRFGDNSSAERHPVKIFDHNVYQKKAVRVFLSYTASFILCEDNTVYAVGRNANGMIIPGGGDYVTTATQIVADISQAHTIVGIAPNDTSVMVLTKTGDTFFSGDNSTGGAGDGTTTSKPAGEITTVTSPNMPPSEPLTKNKVSYEIELTEDNKTVYYRPVEGSDGTQYTKIVGNQTSTVNDLTVDAGRNFKLNVYFEDFGKINTFVMPIRFNPKQLEVVNGAGKAYSRTSEVITPGAVGASVGIEQCFTVRDWQGGSLAIGTKDGTYPKISNADGWVSVAGYSADSNPIIEGKVKMFSISFRARTTVTGNGIAFDFATADNIVADNNNLGNGYDMTCNGLENGKAYWSIYNATGNGGESGYFEFGHEPFPKFNSRLVQLTGLGMSLTYGTNNNPVTDLLGTSDPFSPGWSINWSNTNVTYTLTADPYSGPGKNNPGASFPQVNWSYDTAQVTGANNLDRSWEDYITIVDEQDTYIRFKINPNFVPVTDEDPGFIRVTATSQSYTNVNAVYYISLRSYSAPDTLEMAQKDSGGNLVQIADGAELVYHYTSDPGENRTFYVDFGGATNNIEVVWSLLDANGDPIDNSDPDAKVTLARNNDGSVNIEPHYTTKGNDYVTLHVESLYDASKCDEVKIKVQLYATNLGFSPDTIRMSVMKDGVISSVDLSQYLQVQPVDVYATNYTWEILSNPTRDPANASKVDPSFVPGTDVVYGSLGTGTTAATFTAFEWATPVGGADSESVQQTEEFVTVRVTDTLSGKSADVKIAIMDLESPIGIDQFAATNNLGYINDTVMVKSGLKLGDVLDFYPSYEDAMNKTNRYSQTTIVEGMYPYFTFVVGNRDGGLMKGEGGFLAVTVTRQEDDDVAPRTYDPVPVSYSAEPSLVDGYIHLFGKNEGSIADQGIRVDLEGLNFKETVYTDSTGYFKFTKYIAPGTYKMVVSKQNYLTRRLEANSSGVGGLNIQVNDSGEFHISTYNQPILLFPGELNNDNAITIQDINYYVANWVGQYDDNIAGYDSYDFYEDSLISLRDLELLLMRKDWVSGSYPVWTVPNQ